MELRFVGAKFLRRRRHCFVGNRFRKLREYGCTRMPPGKRIALYYVYLPTSVSLCKHLHRYNLFFISVRLTHWMLRFDRVSSSTTNTAGYFFRFFVYFLMYLQIYRGTDKNLKSLLSRVYVYLFPYPCSYIVIIHLSKRQKFSFWSLIKIGQV